MNNHIVIDRIPTRSQRSAVFVIICRIRSETETYPYIIIRGIVEYKSFVPFGNFSRIAVKQHFHRMIIQKIDRTRTEQFNRSSGVFLRESTYNEIKRLFVLENFLGRLRRILYARNEGIIIVRIVFIVYCAHLHRRIVRYFGSPLVADKIKIRHADQDFAACSGHPDTHTLNIGKRRCPDLARNIFKRNADLMPAVFTLSCRIILEDGIIRIQRQFILKI